MVHPPFAQVARDFVVPQMPEGGKLSDVMLLIIGIVGTTVAPWQLFFQQSYVIDKRITPRFIRYERLDLWIGIALVIIGGGAIMAFTAATFAGQPEFGNFTDAGGIAGGIGKYVGRTAGVMFAIALIDAALIGASAVSLSTAYAIGDVFSARHSLHRKVTRRQGLLRGLLRADRHRRGDRSHPRLAARASDARRAGARRRAAAERDGVPAAALQRQAGSRPLGEHPLAERLHRRRHRRSGDPVGDPHRVGAVPGRHQRAGDPRHPRRRRRRAVIVALVIMALSQNGGSAAPAEEVAAARWRATTWRMPPLDQLPPAKLSLAAKTWMGVLRLYLVVAGGLVLFRIVMLALGRN